MGERTGWLERVGGRCRSVGVAVVVVACVGWFPVSEAFAGDPALGGLCPDGYIEETNAGFSFNDVGCSICRPDESCMEICLTVPVQLCPVGPSPENQSCCEANPCNGNCPEPDDPLLCSVRVCGCEPAGCCTRVCPAQKMAPVTSWNGLAVLAIFLTITGGLYASSRART